MLQPSVPHPVPRRTVFHDRLAALRATPTGRRWLYVGAVVALAGLYYGAAKIGLRLAYLGGAVTALWPPVGVGIAVLVLFGTRLWPGIVIGDLLAADYSTPIGTVLGQTVGNTLEVVIAAAVLRRLIRGRIDLERVGRVLALVVAGALGTLVSACFGAVSLRLGDVISASIPVPKCDCDETCGARRGIGRRVAGPEFDGDWRAAPASGACEGSGDRLGGTGECDTTDYRRHAQQVGIEDQQLPLP